MVSFYLSGFLASSHCRLFQIKEVGTCRCNVLLSTIMSLFALRFMQVWIVSAHHKFSYNRDKLFYVHVPHDIVT